MPSPYGIAIFCEDVRQEAEGKNSYMGIFGATINLRGKKPAVLPKFVIAAHVNIPSSFHRPKVTIIVRRVSTEDTEEISKIEGELETPEDRAIGDGIFTQLVAINTILSFKVDDDCLIEASAHVNDTEISLGSIPMNFVSE